jgi:hypothetical protein
MYLIKKCKSHGLPHGNPRTIYMICDEIVARAHQIMNLGYLAAGHSLKGVAS